MLLVEPVDDGVPPPRSNSQRLTGTAATKATASETVSDHQNSGVSSVAAIAPGTTSRKTLSTTSMVRIEMVSLASAAWTAVRLSAPMRRTPV